MNAPTMTTPTAKAPAAAPHWATQAEVQKEHKETMRVIVGLAIAMIAFLGLTMVGMSWVISPKFDAVTQRLDTLNQRMDGFDKRFDTQAADIKESKQEVTELRKEFFEARKDLLRPR